MQLAIARSRKCNLGNIIKIKGIESIFLVPLIEVGEMEIPVKFVCEFVIKCLSCNKSFIDYCVK